MIINISHYVNNPEYIDYLGIKCTEFNSFIEVRNNMMVRTPIVPVLKSENRITIIVNKILDVIGNCSFEGDNVILQSIINVNGFVKSNYKNIYPGSYVGGHLFDWYNICVNKMYIHGYVMNNGVLS